VAVDASDTSLAGDIDQQVRAVFAAQISAVPSVPGHGLPA
jgi:hypothetical protein